MAKTRKSVHYFRDGTKYRGAVHKMPDGSIHTGARHTAASKPVVHFKDLSQRSRTKAARR